MALIIAEAGSCHDGALGKALMLVHAAKDAGADAVKYQYWSDPDQLADRRRVPTFYRDIYRKYAVPTHWLRLLMAHCQDLGLGFALTTYLPQDVEVAATYASILKIASFEAEAQDMLDAHARYVPSHVVVISLGMGAQKRLVGTPDSRPMYLRCISAYPAPIDSLHLVTLRTHGYDGLSDHTEPAYTWTGALAVTAGARVIEAHVRLPNTDMNNPDAPHAMSPAQFAEYVRNVRFAETCMGSPDVPVDVPLPCEHAMAQYRATERP